MSKGVLCARRGQIHRKADHGGHAQPGDAFFRVVDALSLTEKEGKTELEGYPVVPQRDKKL